MLTSFGLGPPGREGPAGQDIGTVEYEPTGERNMYEYKAVEIHLNIVCA